MNTKDQMILRDIDPLRVAEISDGDVLVLFFENQEDGESGNESRDWFGMGAKGKSELSGESDSVCELDRLSDLALNQWEAYPGGLIELAEDLNDAGNSDSETVIFEGIELEMQETVMPGQADSPSTGPLPYLWSMDESDTEFATTDLATSA
jgi:hypothetical protein